MPAAGERRAGRRAISPSVAELGEQAQFAATALVACRRPFRAARRSRRWQGRRRRVQLRGVNLLRRASAMPTRRSPCRSRGAGYVASWFEHVTARWQADGRVPGPHQSCRRQAQKTDAKMCAARCCCPTTATYRRPSRSSRSSPTTCSAAMARPAARSTPRHLFYLMARGIPKTAGARHAGRGFPRRGHRDIDDEALRRSRLHAADLWLARPMPRDGGTHR